MRKIREVLRLHSLGLTLREIARSCSAGQSAVPDYLKAAEAAGLRWADILDWSQDRLEKAPLPSQPAARGSRHHGNRPRGGVQRDALAGLAAYRSRAEHLGGSDPLLDDPQERIRRQFRG
ncbi:MAG: hypothetical protein IPM24_15835 [Bryobacterales bacterium]|nr:hypothetical protein [Bryobacterales bacterium]